MENLITAPDAAPSERLTAACAGEIDKVVEEMLRQSRDNYAQIEELALECSSALTSAAAKANGLSEQSLFRRLWNIVTGKNERLRTAIEQDRAAAQYAMQQAINSVLKECTQNRLLALAVKSKLENDMIAHQSEDGGASGGLSAGAESLLTEEEEAEEIPWEETGEASDEQEETLEELEALWISDDLR